MRTVFEAAGGDDGLRRLAGAWHRRVMADDVVGHAFSHGFHPQHVERLAAYWAEALGGPSTYSDSYGDETTVVKMHSGNGEHDEMDRRAIDCFDQALADVGLADDGALRQVLHDYFAWATTKQCPATTSPPMMCLTASASHTGRGTDSRYRTPRLTCTTPVMVPTSNLFDYFILTTVAEAPCQPKGRSLLTAQC
jgi:hemoglobin